MLVCIYIYTTICIGMFLYIVLTTTFFPTFTANDNTIKFIKPKNSNDICVLYNLSMVHFRKKLSKNNLMSFEKCVLLSQSCTVFIKFTL